MIFTNFVITAVTGSVVLSQWQFSAVASVEIARSVAAFCKMHSVEVLRDYALVCKYNTICMEHKMFLVMFKLSADCQFYSIVWAKLMPPMQH